MKPSMILSFLLLVCGAAMAQTQVAQTKTANFIVCTPSREQLMGYNPIFAIFVDDKMALLSNSKSDSSFNKIKPNDIKTINILKDSAAVKRYGTYGSLCGVIEVYLKPGVKLNTTQVNTPKH